MATRSGVTPASSLVCRDRVLATAEFAATRAQRRRGLLGRDSLDGVLVLAARSVHTVGMRFAIDVAFCDPTLVVRRVVTLAPGRVTRVHLHARTAIEAPAGAFARWEVGPGDRLELRDVGLELRDAGLEPREVRLGLRDVPERGAGS